MNNLIRESKTEIIIEKTHNLAFDRMKKGVQDVKVVINEWVAILSMTKQY